LYTERAHHFRRYALRGVKKVILYGVPENPVFFKEVVGGFLGASVREGMKAEEARVRVLFSKWEKMRLERIVGTERVMKLIGDKGDVFDFF
jgi:U3 small nucleolar RNA-associated protein 25